MRLALSAAAVVVALLLPAPGAAAPEILTLPTREGVTLPVLWMVPDKPAKGTLIIFPGGHGTGFFRRHDRGIRLGNNFLVRSAPRFVAEGFVVAIVDTPSDQPQGMSDHFRTSREHVADLGHLISFIEDKGTGPVALVGTSRGTLSAAHVGMSPLADRVATVVLTASLGVAGRNWFAVTQLPIQRIRRPVLLVHHRDDGCRASPFSGAVDIQKQLKGSPRVDLVEVIGGDPARSEPCEALSAHGFLGREPEVVRAIAEWLQGQPVPRRIPQ